MCKALCSDRALMELAEWVGGWVDVPVNDKARTLPQSTDYTWAAGSACKSPGVNWKEGKRASIFKHHSLCSWPAETAHDRLTTTEPDFHAHIQLLQALSINEMVFIDFTPYMDLRWVVFQLSGPHKQQVPYKIPFYCVSCPIPSL